MMNDTPFVPAQPPSGASKPVPIMWGRIISLLGALGLFVSFFLPHFDFIASTAPVGLIGHESLLPVERSGYIFILPFIAAPLLLPVLAFRASHRVDASKSGGGGLAWAQCVISLAVLILSLAWMTWVLITAIRSSGAIRPPYILYAIPAEGFPVLVLTFISLIRSRLARKAAAALFALWSYYLVFFIVLATIDEPNYFGLWVTLAGFGLLVLGAVIDWFQSRPARPAALA